MEKFLVLTDDDQTIQTKLNQWRHKYYIEILGMCQRRDQVTYLIKRIDKEEFK